MTINASNVDIYYSVTFERSSAEDSEIGQAGETGFVFENESIEPELSTGGEPHETVSEACYAILYSSLASQPTSSAGSAQTSYVAYKSNDGTDEYYLEGITENRSYHFDGLTDAIGAEIFALVKAWDRPRRIW